MSADIVVSGDHFYIPSHFSSQKLYSKSIEFEKLLVWVVLFRQICKILDIVASGSHFFIPFQFSSQNLYSKSIEFLKYYWFSLSCSGKYAKTQIVPFDLPCCCCCCCFFTNTQTDNMMISKIIDDNQPPFIFFTDRFIMENLTNILPTYC